MRFARSVLVLGRHSGRRLAATDAFRSEGAVVVEAATVRQANAILRQLQFDVLAVDSYGLGVAVTKLLHDFGADYPDTRISVMGPPVENDALARFHRSQRSDRLAACSDTRRRSGDAKPRCEGESWCAGLDRIRGAGLQGRSDGREGK